MHEDMQTTTKELITACEPLDRFQKALATAAMSIAARLDESDGPKSTIYQLYKEWRITITKLNEGAPDEATIINDIAGEQFEMTDEDRAELQQLRDERERWSMPEAWGKPEPEPEQPKPESKPYVSPNAELYEQRHREQQEAAQPWQAPPPERIDSYDGPVAVPARTAKGGRFVPLPEASMTARERAAWANRQAGLAAETSPERSASGTPTDTSKLSGTPEDHDGVSTVNFRRCKHCGKQLPKTKRYDAKFCKQRCKSAYYREKAAREAYERELATAGTAPTRVEDRGEYAVIE